MTIKVAPVHSDPEILGGDAGIPWRPGPSSVVVRLPRGGRDALAAELPDHDVATVVGVCWSRIKNPGEAVSALNATT